MSESSNINNHHVALELASTMVVPPRLEPEDALGPEAIPTVGTDPTQKLEIPPSRRPQYAPVVAMANEPDIVSEPTRAPGQDPLHTVVTTPLPTVTPEPELNLPFQDLFADDRRQDFFDICSPLYKACMEGDWRATERILRRTNQDYKRLVQCSITNNCETVLHVAASFSQSTDFVRNLVGMMQKEDLLYLNKNGNTALCLAAMTGNVEIAKIMVNENRELLKIRNLADMTPLYIAALYGKREMVNYLYAETNRDEWTYTDNKWVCLKCVETDLFDIALQIYPKLPATEGKQETQSILGILARKPSAFEETKPHIMRRTCNPKIWPEKVLYGILRGPVTVVTETSQDGQSPKQKLTNPERVLFVAAEMGNTKFLVELFGKYPDLIWKVNDDNLSIFHVAVSRRHESIYNLLYEIGSMKDLIVVGKDKDGNTMLHLVSKNAENNRLHDVSGAAFQMQRRLLWYKEVKSMIPPSYRERKNIEGQTPYELFTTTHKDLLSEAEKWMRGTASKCMLVATLIATIVFGVAYTIPGGYDQKLGFPIFRHNAPFIVFVVLDAISLILSATSILVFLSILTSRYAQEDFIESLPNRLMVGLTMLFLSIVTMMMAFSVSFYVLYRHKFAIVAGSISLLALIPVISYGLLHFPLLKDMYRLTYGSRYLFKPKKQMLYCQNPRF